MSEPERPRKRGPRPGAAGRAPRPEPYPGAAERGRPLLAISDEELVERISANDATAYHECMVRFGSLLHELAIRFGAAPDRAWETVTLVLDDVMDRTHAHRYPQNRKLGAYLVTALRRRIFDERRDDGVRRRVERDSALETETPGQLVVRSLCSEHAWRAMRPPGEGDENDRRTLPPAVQALHDALVALLDEDDRRVLDWRGDHVVQREMAEWLGEAHGTTRNRLSRVRGDMRRAARLYIASLADDCERAVIERFLTGWLRRSRNGSDAPPPRRGAGHGYNDEPTAAERAAEDDDA